MAPFGYSSPSLPLEAGPGDSLSTVICRAAVGMSVNPGQRHPGLMSSVTSRHTLVMVMSWDHLSRTTAVQL